MNMKFRYFNSSTLQLTTTWLSISGDIEWSVILGENSATIVAELLWLDFFSQRKRYFNMACSYLVFLFVCVVSCRFLYLAL
jgi:hypothetical protein